MRGIPAESIYAIDIHDGYWNAGRALFKDDVPGSSSGARLCKVNESFFDMSLSLHAPTTIESTFADAFRSFDFIFMQAVLHTMSKEQQRASLTRVLHMLKSGSGMVLGTTVGALEATEWAFTPTGNSPRFLNSCESLTQLLLDVGFTSAVVIEKPREAVQRAMGISTSDSSNAKQKSALDEDLKNRIYIEFSAVA